jgi:hypothetical protein
VVALRLPADLGGTHFLFGMPIVSTSLLLALETDLPMVPPVDHPPQAIDILSAGMIRTHQEKLGFRPGLLSLDRLRTAAMMHRRTGLPILVSGGDARPGSPALADVLALSLDDDFQTQARWVEAKSSDTWENARLPSTDLMSVSGPEKPGREVRPGLCPGPAKGAALGTSLSVFAASGLNSLHCDSVAALKG